MIYDFYDTNNAAFFSGFVSNLQEKHYSNSDVTRLVKSAATYSGQLAISNNLFYSTNYLYLLCTVYAIYVATFCA